MKFFIILINLLIFYVAASSAAASAFYAIDPEHPGKCVHKAEGLILSVGEVRRQPGICGIIECGKGSLLQKTSCGVYGVPKGCKLKTALDPDSIYPNCCPTGVICNDVLGVDKPADM